jgi:hypothetical protein
VTGPTGPTGAKGGIQDYAFIYSTTVGPYSNGSAIYFSSSYTGTTKTTGSIRYNLITTSTQITLDAGTYVAHYRCNTLGIVPSANFGLELRLDGTVLTESRFFVTYVNIVYGHCIFNVPTGSKSLGLHVRTSTGGSVNFVNPTVPKLSGSGSDTGVIASIIIEKVG